MLDDPGNQGSHRCGQPGPDPGGWPGTGRAALAARQRVSPRPEAPRPNAASASASPASSPGSAGPIQGGDIRARSCISGDAPGEQGAPLDEHVQQRLVGLAAGPGGSSRGRWPRPSGRRSWTCCIPGGSLTSPLAEIWAIWWIRASTWVGVYLPTGVLVVGESRERRAQATHPAAVKPELAADRPNRVYSWDITKLHGPAKWTYYHLYVILDIYSRYAVGWMVATRESAALAKLIAATCAKQGISRGQLNITLTAAPR